jgi:xanthine dehydrogenase accessory factor
METEMSNARELRRIVRLWESEQARVLVTLVAARGSTYRGTGARLLLADSGRSIGTISGGCLESEVVRKAAWATRHGAVVEHYSTAIDDMAEIPYGLGCGGEVDLLLEPANTPEAEALRAALVNSLGGKLRIVATWLPAVGIPMQRAVWDEKGKLLFSSPTLPAGQTALPPADGAEIDGAAIDAAEIFGTEIYVERLTAPQRLICCGAGDDAQPLVECAAMLGWTVLVADGRPQLARPDRFPLAERVLVASCAEDLELRPTDAVVVMTHSYEQDRSLLAGLLPKPLGYLGILGARHRSSLLLEEAATLSGLSLAEACARVFAPVGLDLGGDGPEPIALAIVAEIQAFTQGRIGASRRLTPEIVSEQLAAGASWRYTQVQCALGTGV